MAGGSALLRRRPLVLGGLALLVALAIAVTLAVTKPWASTKTREDVAAPAAGDRVLQSVDVTMQGDGALTRVGDTVVIARAQGGKADTYSTSYDPTKVVDQLPVRVLTAYQTDKGSGTDLGDLKGYTGRITINLTVQNLTVAPQQVTYDAAGKAVTTTAQVGAPLTVVASAALPGINPANVVTAASDAPADASNDFGATNGVLSQGADSSTQVQWASILAPPQLDSTATFRVVLDAKDFQVPPVDLSVQPGLVTDPSVGALIDSAFNPKNSSELALETRTIKLIGDVNGVLGQASDTISDVRTTLDASSKTLGTKTVQSLTEDSRTISTSLKSSSDNIDSLGDDLKQSLQTTQSTTLQRMSDTVSQLQDVIGDTSGPEPSVNVSGSGCATTVEASGGGSGVYGSLLGVIAQLSAYQDATDACKGEIQGQITSTIGPENPDGTDADGNPNCPVDAETPAVTCALADARSRFTAVTASIGAGQDASSKLDPKALQPVDASVAALTTQLEAVDSAVDTLRAPGSNSSSLARAGQALADATTAIESASGSLVDLSTAIDDVHTDAVADAKQADGMTDQTKALRDAICSSTNGGPLPDAKADALLAYLQSTSCGGTRQLTLPDGFDTPLIARVSAQEKAWRPIVAALDTSSDDGTIARSLDKLRGELKDLTASLADATTQVEATRTKLDAVNDDVEIAQTTLVALGSSVTGVENSYVQAKLDLDAALAQAAAQSKEATDKALSDEAIAKVAQQGEASSDQLGAAFDKSADGLAAAADSLRDGTLGTLKQQSDELDSQQADDEAKLNAQTKAGLSTISTSITSATRDIDSTRTSLTKDLTNVLLDLGNPKDPGKGLLGTLGKSARAADSADFQLSQASDTVSSYASVRSQEVGGIMLRQAQAEAALARQASMPAFETDVPPTIQHRTIYLFHLGGQS